MRRNSAYKKFYKYRSLVSNSLTNNLNIFGHNNFSSQKEIYVLNKVIHYDNKYNSLKSIVFSKNKKHIEHFKSNKSIPNTSISDYKFIISNVLKEKIQSKRIKNVIENNIAKKFDTSYIKSCSITKSNNTTKNNITHSLTEREAKQ